MSLDRFLFVLAFCFCSYTGFRIISNSILFYGHKIRYSNRVDVTNDELKVWWYEAGTCIKSEKAF